ncbi:hypothetical protein GCM10011506_23580 [Marivirga lumbricoides]|uniref:Heparin-sulfate lyase N-terminal domain-containing protein n=1 Tax=Marivirga lumbricoides TaxID=1046115 RepID=A0ABQ1MEW5_9BACT|nr:hypothetical protein GCM10011506_23580 [Marivirga lumbricoides]
MFKRLLRIYHTLKYLKPVQFYFRGFYFLRNKIFGNNLKFVSYPIDKKSDLPLLEFPKSRVSYKNIADFEFLNFSKKFKSFRNIDWNYFEFGKLWCYNLNYFDFLLQQDLSKEEGLKLINDYISKAEVLKDGLEPYPISLRNINWIKFLTIHHISNKKIDSFIYSCYLHLLKNLEYHLLGNHLLENAFSIFMGSIYFNDEKLYERAKRNLKTELTEQILDDGAHFELSPMYHHILLERLLDSINFAKSSTEFEDQTFLDFLSKKAEVMLSWMEKMKMSNGDMPLLNDSGLEIAKSADALIEYAQSIGVTASENTILKSSGYRKYKSPNWELITDAGKPGPEYIPGHSHADIGNFILYNNNKPFIIDPGISTYEKNGRRNLERSTEFHNTVVVDAKNQSDVWGGFRLGKRAEVKILKESGSYLKLSHNGYKSICGDHIREFQFSDTLITIQDVLSIGSRNCSAIAYFHLSKSIKIVDKGTDEISFDNGVIMKFANAISIDVEKYNCPDGFNSYITCDKLAVHFNKSLETQIF